MLGGLFKFIEFLKLKGIIGANKLDTVDLMWLPLMPSASIVDVYMLKYGPPWSYLIPGNKIPTSVQILPCPLWCFSHPVAYM
jgi:hypothetical protein